MVSKAKALTTDDAKLAEYSPVVCVELIENREIKEAIRPLGSAAWNSVQVGNRKSIAGLLSPPHLAKFQLSRRSVAVSMGRHVRAMVPEDENSSIAVQEKKSSTVQRKKEAEVASKNRSLRSSNVMNIPAIEKKKLKTPSPPSTPSTRSRSLGRFSTSVMVAKDTTTVAAAITRRLLPVAAPPKTCPRILRQTPQRKGISAYADESASASSSSDESSASSTMCSPRKKSAMTPSTRSKAKSIAMAVDDSDTEPVALPTRSGKTPTTRKSVRPSVASEAPHPQPSAKPRGRPSTKPTAIAAEDSPLPKSNAAPNRRRGLLKTGTTAKAAKHTVNSSPTSWSSDLDESDHEVNNEADSNESLLVRALNRLHISKEEFSRQVAISSKGSNWAPLGREHEAGEIFNFVADHLKSGTSGSLFVAGVPGIGKSATIGAVLDRLNVLASGNKSTELPRFRLVTVNGFHFATPVRFYCEVHRQLLRQSSSTKSAAAKGAHRGNTAQQKLKRSLGPKAALDTLNAYFTGKSSLGGVLPTVLVVDELDALVSATSANQIAFGGGQNAGAARRTTSFGANRVLYNLLEWASTPVSRLVIVAVANTLDLPERALPLRVVSRLGLHRLAFMPYTHVQLESIVRARLSTLPNPVFDSADAILLASRKVAMASGDARRVLELCRLAVERAIRQNRNQATMQDVVAASDSLSSATSRLALVRQVAISWRRVLTALVNVCRMQCRDHGACLVRELHTELIDMWREEGGFSRPSDVEVIRIIGQMVACGLLAAEDVSQLGIQAHVQLTMPLPDLAAILASLLGTNGNAK